MPITYQQDFFVNIRKDLEHLAFQHWEEVEAGHSDLELDPDWEAYEVLEGEGALKVFTARDDGNLVGYFLVVCQKSLHYRDSIFAYNDAVFVSPTHRRSGVGAELIKVAEKWLKEDKISVLVINTKVDKPFDQLLGGLGYTHAENIYTKLLR